MYKIQDFFIKIEVGLHGIKQILLMFFIWDLKDPEEGNKIPKKQPVKL